MKESILDLGVGKGGDYLLRKKPETLQVGIDIRSDKIKILQKNSNGETVPVVADVADGLPFASETFKRVQMLFPDDDILYGLCYSDGSLWPELHRVLKKGGVVEMFIDVPFFRYTEVLVNKKEWLKIFDPQVKIRSRCEEFGFSFSMEKISRRTVKELGTNFSDQFARWMCLPFFFSVYKISARKRD
jgi:SAM-dependent methyltransferase